MSPAVCAAAGRARVTVSAAANAQAGWDLPSPSPFSTMRSAGGRGRRCRAGGSGLLFDERSVNREVVHHSLPVIVLDQRHRGNRMAVLHVRPYADRKVAGIVTLRFPDGLSELARRAEQTVALLLGRRQVIAAGDRLGFYDLTRVMVDDHLEIFDAVPDGVDRQLRLAVLDFEFGGDRLAVFLACFQPLLKRYLGVGDDRRELGFLLVAHSAAGGDNPTGDR